MMRHSPGSPTQRRCSKKFVNLLTSVSKRLKNNKIQAKFNREISIVLYNEVGSKLLRWGTSPAPIATYKNNYPFYVLNW